jgi:hypothetical protein
MPSSPAPETTVAPSTTAAPSTTLAPSTTQTRVTAPAPAEGLAGCAPYFDTATFTNHEYEVCTAYVVNSADIALQAFYKLGNNSIGLSAETARSHFETRYYDQPRQAIEQEVASWPTTSGIFGNSVEQSVTVMSLSSNESQDRGVLQTQESWKVTAQNGTVLLDEPMKIKDITMCRGRLPGHPLHEWAVVENVQNPNFDCIGFDQTHGLEP